MELNGDKNIVANAGGVAKQITNINIEGMNAEQFKSISEQLNQVLGAVGINNKAGLKPGDLTVEQKVIGKAVQKKVDEAEIILHEESATSSAYLNLGIFEGKSGNYNEAILYFDKALKLASNSAQAWNFKGQALCGLGQYAESLQYFDKALGINPKLDDAWFCKGDALRLLDKYEKAIRCYENAMGINPRSSIASSATRLKGECLTKLGRIEEARLYFKLWYDNPPNR